MRFAKEENHRGKRESMKKKKTSFGSSFSALPANRKEQFKDILKNQYGFLIRIGILLFLFLIPLVSCLVVADLFGQALKEGNAAPLNYLYNDLLLGAGLLVSSLVFAFGIAGISHLLRMLCWGEPIIFWNDFRVGMKQNWTKDALLLCLLALLFSLDNVLSDLFTIFAPSSGAGFVLWSVLLGIIVFFAIPYTMVGISYNSYYKDEPKRFFANVLRILVARYFPLFLFVLPIFGLIVLYFFTNIIYFAVFVFLLIFLGPVFLSAWRLFILAQFDDLINPAFLDYYKKGLYIGGTADEEN